MKVMPLQVFKNTRVMTLYSSVISTDTCVVIELRKESPHISFQKIIKYVKSSIIHFAGEHALPLFVLVSVYIYMSQL